ncbi:MAG: hypothetical protein K0S29_1052 [Gammaproteobacteria bacterium]|jgi:NAD(P)H-hydrate epimerase|nr:hypothetical protein [Gammaproteobacteria bacterium]
MDPITLCLERVLADLPPRAPDSHKGNFGHVAILAGDRGMPGAANLCMQGSARIGAGLVSLFTHPDHAAFVNLFCPEVMCYGVNQFEQIEAVLNRASVLVLGPGLINSDWSQSMLNMLLSSRLPMVIDAGAFILIQQRKLYRTNWILTPHPGEAARLLNISIEEVQANRPKAVTEMQSLYGGVVLLKGQHSLIASSSQLYQCPYGNPGMASGGMGDMLSGILGGLIAQGLSLEQACCLGVCLHAKAADLAAEEWGERGLLASDLFPYLRKLLNNKALKG